MHTIKLSFPLGNRTDPNIGFLMGLGNLAVFGAVDEVGMQTFVKTEQQHFFGHSTHFCPKNGFPEMLLHPPQLSVRGVKISLAGGVAPPGCL